MDITLQPTSNTTPDPGQGGTAVVGAVNTGHGSTTASASDGSSQTRTCLWTGFSGRSGAVTAPVLKLNWTESGSLTALSASNGFIIEYSLNNGSSWNTLLSDFNVTSSSSGTAQATLPLSQDTSQVRVRDGLFAETGDLGETAIITGTVSLIRIEIQTADGQMLVMM